MATPKLRFKEFDGEWHQSSLGQLTNYFKGYAFKSESYKERGVRIIRVSDLGRDSIKYDNDAIFLDEAESSDYENWMLKKHDIIITTVGSKPHLIDSAVGRPIYIKNNYEGLLNQNLLVLRPINNEIEPYFIFSQLLDNKYLTHIETIQRGNANQSNITVKDLQEFKVFSTAKTEQTKIASFLSTVDEKISQLNQKHKLLSQYKQGMMQKLFSQQFRFKADNGGEFGGWVEIKITDVADYVDYRGKTPRKVEDGILLVTAKNIRFGYIDYSISQEYICSDDFDEVMRRGRAEIGDVLITTEAPLGNVASVDRENIALAQRVIKYRGKKGILNNEFLKQKFLSEEFQSLISSKATGGTVQGIKGSTLHNLEINIPEDIEEQTKIANFLATIDQKIEVVAKQIEQAKQWKKGLLQQMFV